MTTWLLLDVSYLAHRAMHSTGFMQHEGQQTGALFGMFREVFYLRRKFGADNVCWCFDDRRENLRRTELYPPYKLTKTRLESYTNQEFMSKKRGIIRQLSSLYSEHLDSAGCENVKMMGGYEADDVIAWYCKGIEGMDGDKRVIMISADQDLYQLLRTTKSYKAVMYNPTLKQLTTKKSFVERYIIPPSAWPDYKALAGCTSDNIPGIRGVGPQTALAYLQGCVLNQRQRLLIGDDPESFALYKKLTVLPFPGDEVVSITPILKPDPEESSEKWRKVFRKLGFFSFTKDK